MANTVKPAKNEGDGGLRDYELIVIISPEVADEEITATLDRISRFIVERGGSITEVSQWGRRKLAYPIKNYMEEYEHPLWKTLGEIALGSGHRGSDYIMSYRLIQALRQGKAPDMDVYDAASWSVVSELSERSVANKSKAMDFPDFTRGKWKTNTPIFVTDV